MGLDGEIDDGDETEREEISRPLRRQPSNKTVTWAETEEVLEFEVEEERRRSMMSDASTASEDDRRFYNNGDSSDDYDEEEDEDLRPYQPRQHSENYSFQEGGSIEVHDVEDSDAEESVVSTTSSAMDDMIEQIDDFIQEESFDERDVFARNPLTAPAQPRGYSSRPAPPTSASSMSSNSAAGDVVSEVEFDHS